MSTHPLIQGYVHPPTFRVVSTPTHPPVQQYPQLHVIKVEMEVKQHFLQLQFGHVSVSVGVGRLEGLPETLVTIAKLVLQLLLHLQRGQERRGVHLVHRGRLVELLRWERGDFLRIFLYCTIS